MTLPCVRRLFSLSPLVAGRGSGFGWHPVFHLFYQVDPEDPAHRPFL
jgi:hypothetical protein